MTRALLNEIRAGRTPMTEAHVDDVLATAKAVVLAAPSPAALVRLYDFTSKEIETLAIHRGITEQQIAGLPDDDRKTELMNRIFVHG